MDFALVCLVALLPLSNLTTGGGSGIFYLLLACCLIKCVVRDGGWRATVRSLAQHQPLIIATFLPLVAVVLSQLANGNFHGPSVERAARFAIAFPILLGAFLAVDRKALRQSTWGFILAGWASASIVIWLVLPKFQRPNTPEYNAVGYGNLMLLAVVFIVYSVRWQLTPYPRAERALKVISGIVVFGAFILTETRTGWMALPIFFAVGLLLLGRFHHPIKLAVVAVLGVAALVALGSTSQALRERVDQGFQEVRECTTTNRIAETSVCIRLQLWRASVDIVEQHPWFGLGSTNRFADELQARVAQGVVAPFVAEDFGEPHNDMLYMLTSFGLLGGLALLAVYIVPAVAFAKRFHNRYPTEIRAAAAMGLALTLGFAVFGLTELMFRGMRTISLYVALVAWLVALSTPSPGEDFSDGARKGR
ncbi:O-antigen ligase family protein [Achromobacter insolitus]|uniref:O-antigen ligase family protein n=1 Tax=Achromobacter insolitus TaxID=217204 RepID=UPI00165605AB|nr:O-antigen ligase family protein [Achromobacter insolitus]